MLTIHSNSISFRLVEECDSDIIYTLRKQYGTFLNNTHCTQEYNRHYIQQYRVYVEECISQGIPLTTYYFVITAGSSIIGTIRLYNIQYLSREFTWGSWILSARGGGRAICSACMLYAFAFEYLNLNIGRLDVRKENITVISFHKKIGASYIGEDKENIYFTYDKARYTIIREKYHRYLGDIRISYMDITSVF